MWTLIILLLILYALGVGFYPLGGLIHLLLVVILIVVLVQWLTGRQTLPPP